jgi:hypothetical protein
MTVFRKKCRYGLLAAMTLFVTGCASTGSNPLNGETAALPLIPGEATLQVSKVNTASLSLPASARLTAGSVLKFSPIEFRSDKDRFSIDAVAMPLGRYVAVRHSAEGVTADLQADDARSFDLHYDARYPDMQAARRDFPNLAKEQYRSITLAGKNTIEIEQWHLRLTMLFSKDRQAFRVLLDNIVYTAPQPPPPPADETPVKAAPLTLPIVVAFSYQHPDGVTEQLIQQNVFFEFKVSNNDTGYHGVSQISGWVPLHAHAQSQAYTVGIVLAEVHEKGEALYKKLFDFVKSVRGVI